MNAREEFEKAYNEIMAMKKMRELDKVYLVALFGEICRKYRELESENYFLKEELDGKAGKWKS